MKYWINLVVMNACGLAARNAQVHHGHWMMPLLLFIAFVANHVQMDLCDTIKDEVSKLAAKRCGVEYESTEGR